MRILKNFSFGILLGLFLTFVIACGKSEDQAEALFSVGQLEEKQFNPKHASELYQEVIKKYPDTNWAEKAQERIKEIKRQKTAE